MKTMNKPILILPNGLKVSVKDKTNKGIICSFTHKYFCISDSVKTYPLSEITAVYPRYDWVNALGENDFAYEDDIVYYYAEDIISKEQLHPNIIHLTYFFSKQSDAELYLNSLKKEEKKCPNCKYSDVNCLPIIGVCEVYDKWQPKEEKGEDVLDAYDFFDKSENSCMSELMLLFAKEACKRQREICAKSYKDSDFNNEYSVILNAPEPKWNK
jgi:hypothetical protein